MQGKLVKIDKYIVDVNGFIVGIVLKSIEGDSFVLLDQDVLVNIDRKILEDLNCSIDCYVFAIDRQNSTP